MPGSTIIRSAAVSAIVAAIIMLSGCMATGPKYYDSDPEEFTSRPETHGVVVFQVVNMNSRLHRYMYGWHTLRASRIGGGPATWLKEGEAEPKYAVYADYRPIPGTSLWIGLLPAGNYLAEDLYSSFNNGNMYGHLTAPIPDAFASFRIEPGKVTLLDAYLYNGFGDNFRMTNVESPDELLEKAKEAHPHIMASIDTDAPLRFPAGTRDDPEKALYDTGKWAETVGMSEYAPDGRVYRAARLGRIFERTPSGEWRIHGLDTFEPVRFVYGADNGEVIAIAQGGDVFRRATADAAFARAPVAIDGKLRSLARTDGGEWVASTVASRTSKDRRNQPIETFELEVLKAASLDATDWQSVAKLPVERAYASVTVSGSRAIVVNPGGSTTVIDITTGQRFTAKPGFAFVRAYSDGRMLGYTSFERGFWFNDPSEIWSSNDGGETWEQLPYLEPKGMPELMDDGSVQVLGKRVRNRKTGETEYEGFLRIDSPSKHWQSVEKLPEGCGGWVELKNLDDGLLVLCEYNAFRRPEGGSNWIDENMRQLVEKDAQEE